MKQDITNPKWLLTATMLFGLATGCAPVATNMRPAVSPSLGELPATVTVDNQQVADMRVYIVVGGAQYRLGLVSALSSATFKIPRVISLSSDVRFVAASLASEDSHSTPAVRDQEGDAIVFTIVQTRTMTNLLVRRSKS